MREIKFRGLRNNRWVYGYYNYQDKSNIHEIISKEHSHIGVSVISESVGQYTGLKDKNGVEIYEGDLVKCWDSSAEDPLWGLDKVHTGIIEYAPNCYSLKIPGKQTLDTPACKHWENDTYLDQWINAENIEVVGNIHEPIPQLTKS